MMSVGSFAFGALCTFLLISGIEDECPEYLGQRAMRRVLLCLCIAMYGGGVWTMLVIQGLKK